MPGKFISLFGNFYALQVLHSRGFGFLAWDLFYPDRCQRTILHDRQVWEQIKMLETHADFTTNRVNIFQIVGQLDIFDNDVTLLVFLESVHKIAASLADMADILGGARLAFVGREMTKLHEQCVRATLGELSTMLSSGEITKKGEFVVVVGGAAEVEGSGSTISSRDLLSELVTALPGSQAVDIVARLTGEKKNDVYRTMLELKSERGDES